METSASFEARSAPLPYPTTGMLLGMKESYKKGESESILAPSLAGVVARRQSKRRQGYRWAWVIELRKTLIGALNPFSDGEGNTAGCATSRVTSWPCVV